jgi:L-lysine 6-transaminase
MSVSIDNVRNILSEYLIDDRSSIIPDFARCYGQYIFDLKTSGYYLDCAGYYGSNPIGHNHPGLNEPSFLQKLLNVAKTNPSNSDFFSLEMADFVDTFARIALPPQYKHLFFVTGGTLAIENALKVAFDWKVRKNFQKGLTEEKGFQIIHFTKCFHGRSGYSISMTNTADPRKTKYFPKFKWPRIEAPSLNFPITPEVIKNVELLEQKAISQIKDSLNQHKDDIAALIIEPIQGEGGDNYFRPEFHKKLRELADENEFLLIYDEVQTGLGITGKMWAYQLYEVEPDIVCFGKKTQVCGIFCNSRVDEIRDNVFLESSRINSTWGGNLTDMVRSTRYIEIIHHDKLLENAIKIGQEILNKLTHLESLSPGKICNIRGQGLMIAFDFQTTELRDKAQKLLFDYKIIILKCGNLSLRLRPSLNFSINEVNVFTVALSKTLSAL